MKRNIAILTLQGNANYGNRLQNYALEQVILNNFGNVSSLIIDDRPSAVKALSWIKTQLLGLRDIQKVRQRKAKHKIFIPFSKSYLHVTKQKRFDSHDFVIVGSDQVWNPQYMRKTDKGKWFLDFVPKEKRISYAASFGVSQIPEKSLPVFKNGLLGMKKISVREAAGVHLVSEVSQQKATLVVDPTMLLTKNEWIKFIESEEHTHVPHNKKFILIYTLSELSEEKTSKIKKFAQANNFLVIQIMGDKFDETYHIYNPIEFVEAISKAQMVFTDSFHCSVFSIIFNTAFCVFDRPSEGTGSRINTLLTTFDLQKNQYVSHKETNFQDLYKNTDFSDVSRILEKGRKEGIDFLETAMN